MAVTNLADQEFPATEKTALFVRCIRFPMTFSKKIQDKLMKSGTVVSTEVILRRLPTEFGLKSYKPTSKPRLTQAIKKKISFLLKDI